MSKKRTNNRRSEQLDLYPDPVAQLAAQLATIQLPHGEALTGEQARLFTPPHEPPPAAAAAAPAPIEPDLDGRTADRRRPPGRAEDLPPVYGEDVA